MMSAEATIRLEHRFDLLRQIISDYRVRLQAMEEEVIHLFSSNQLSAISQKMYEKQQIETFIDQLEEFVEVWEAVADMGIDQR